MASPSPQLKRFLGDRFDVMACYAPLTVEVEPQSGLDVGEPIYPSARPFNVEALAEQFHVYEGHVRVTVPIAVNVLAGRGQVTIRVTVRHQACNEKECMPPSESVLEIPFQETPAV